MTNSGTNLQLYNPIVLHWKHFVKKKVWKKQRLNLYVAKITLWQAVQLVYFEFRNFELAWRGDQNQEPLCFFSKSFFLILRWNPPIITHKYFIWYNGYNLIDCSTIFICNAIQFVLDWELFPLLFIQRKRKHKYSFYVQCQTVLRSYLVFIFSSSLKWYNFHETMNLAVTKQHVPNDFFC